MIRQLQHKFIRISMVAVTAVLVMFGLIINIVNIISINAEKSEMLIAIYNNEGRVPDFKRTEKPFDRREMEGPFTPETPFSTRYFVIRYDDDGNIVQSDMKSIASVSDDDLPDYLSEAVSNGEGFGYYSGFKYYVAKTGENRNIAVFLDCYNDIRAILTIALLTAVSIAGCVTLVFIIVVLVSRKAIQPTIQAIEKQKQFITDAGHELKTPITVISTSLTVLEMEVGQQKWIDKAKVQIEKLMELVNNLVTLSKMDEECPPLKFTSFDISNAISETAESFRDSIEIKGIRYTTEITSGLQYSGDEYSIRQLVSILMDNAVKYTEDGVITLSLKESKKAVLIKVINTCEPIEKEKLESLFERFYRPDESRSNRTGGFGIGLSIAKGIASGHGGTIKAANTPSGEIEFTVELPYNHG